MCSESASIHRVPWSAKKKYRVDADLAANYGTGILSKLSPRDEHERRLALVLDIDRIQYWRALSVASGIQFTLGSGVGEEAASALTENKALQAKLLVKKGKRSGKD